MELQHQLRDLLYFDFDKAASLYSQIEGGLPQEVKVGSESSSDKRNVRRYDLKLFQPEFGGVQTEQTSRLESRILHHDLLAKVEEYLIDQGSLSDLNSDLFADKVDAEHIHQRLTQVAYIRAEGWAVFEDYQRMKEIATNFNAIAEFIGRCSMSTLEKTEEYQNLQRQIDEARTRAKEEKDGNKRARSLSAVETQEKKFRALIAESTGLRPIDEWLLEGIRLFTDTFMPNRIIFRVYPFELVPEFQILSNLKQQCFLDSDLDNVVFTYGNRPTLKLTVFGLITSLPAKEDQRFDPMSEFRGVDQQRSDEIGFEQGFRNMFGAFEGFDRFVRYSRYPNVTVYPLAVYRKISGKEDAA
jgi:hypothetical protein